MTTDIRQTWATPPDFFKWLDDQFHFDIDVCASKENAKVSPKFITAEMDAFKTDWFWWPDAVEEQPLSAFCNPGFSNPGRWHRRAFDQCNGIGDEAPFYNIRFACVLGIAGASQEWYDFAYHHTLMIIHLSPRVQYLAPPGVTQTSNNYESVVYVYSSLPPCHGNVIYKRWDPKPRRARKCKGKK